MIVTSYLFSYYLTILSRSYSCVCQYTHLRELNEEKEEEEERGTQLKKMFSSSHRMAI